ncbi:polycystic kidney disease protein 1-like 3 [Sceloporus undulatus]|uniref:polycystic kidney disease protein 1-like 3 n=1 Tax=Sceloporus undulatus TaxID=8520 RepID=UPI001C4D0535|nr:polycystic kidney disease protein 1-like 3 [Sceloporus undulatus]
MREWTICPAPNLFAPGAAFQAQWPEGFARKVWCQRRGAHLLPSWDQQAKEALQSQMGDGTKSWIGPSAQVPREQEQHHTAGTSTATKCQALVQVGDQFWARRMGCLHKLFFICQAGPHRAQREAAISQQRRSTCQRLICRQRPPWRRTTPKAPSLTMGPGSPPQSPQPTTQTLSAARKELSTAQNKITIQRPDPGPNQPSERDPSPGGATRTPLERTESLGTGTFPFTPLQDLSPEAQVQVLERLLDQFSQLAAGPLGPNPEGEAQRLQSLTSSPALLSGSAQASASRSLLALSTHLLKSERDPPATDTDTAAATSDAWQDLFQTLGNLLQAMDLSSGGQREEEVVALEEMLASLPLIQRGLLLDQPPATTTTVVSPVLSTTLSSCTAASLPHSSFHVPQPRPLTVTFPSGPALELLLGQHSRIQVQVASFSLNPFKHLDRRPIGSIASVALAAEEGKEEGLLHVQGLAEEIEVGCCSGVGHGGALLGSSWEPGRWIELGGEAGGKEASAVSSVTGLGTENFSLAVNVTSLEDALLVSMRASSPLRIILCLLGFPPSSKGSSGCLLNTTVLEAQKEEGASVWVIPPESLHHGLGTYFISGEVAPALNGTWNLSVCIYSTGCYYWASQDQAWRTDGCRVGPQSTLLSTQCLCRHLSFFGRLFLVLPHAIDLQHTGLLSRVGQNPAGVALLSVLLLGYAAAFLWVRRRQRDDIRRVRVTVLADNDPSACFLYLVQVFTGYRRGAGTSAQAILTLYGAEGRSRPHVLRHPGALGGFERGGMDAFLLAAQRPLGDLHAVRLWHNEAGPNPSWFVQRLVVQDLSARKRWLFLCNCWLASDMDDGQVDKVFVAASQEELLSFWHLFWAGLVRKLTQEHLWLSVLTCSAWSPFTRIQRLSCCLTLLLCSMLINIMFWKEAPEHGSDPEAGPFVVTWRELVVSMQAAVLMLPVHLLVVRVFQLVQSPPGAPLVPPPASTEILHPPPPSSQATPLTHLQEELMKTLGFLYKNVLWQRREADGFPGALQQVPELVGSLCGLIRSHLLQGLEDPGAPPQERSRCLHSYLCRVVKDLEAQLRGLDWSSLPKPYDHLHAGDQLRQLWKHLECHLPPIAPAAPEGPSPLGHCCCCCFMRPSGWQGSPTAETLVQEKTPGRPSWRLPGRFSFVCWLLVGVLNLVAAFFTILYTLQMNREQASGWAVSILLSVLQSVFLIQPLKVLVLTLLFSLMRMKQLWQNEGQEQQLHRVLSTLLSERQHCPESPSPQRCADPLPRPPALKPMARATERALKEKRLHSLLREIAGQLVFLAVLMVLCYIERSPNEFYLSAALQRRLTAQMDDVRVARQFYAWARGTLLPAVYGDAAHSKRGGHGADCGRSGWRSAPPKSWLPLHLRQEPWATKKGQERESPVAANWGLPGRVGKAQETGAWVYQPESTLQEYPIWGRFALYPGSGYLANLGTNASHAKRVLRHLARHHWLDRGTRAVFVEMVVYNANVNLFCAVTLILEGDGIGALQGKANLWVLRLHASGHTLVHVVCARAAFLLLLLGHALVQGNRLVRQKWHYFGSKKNLLDASALFIGLAAFGLHIKRNLLAQRILAQHHQDRHQFLSLYEVAEMDATVTHLIAFLVALATVKLWNLLRLNPRMQLITQTLQAAWEDLLGFLLMQLVLLAGYSIACNLLFGWSISDYKTFLGSAVTIVGLLIGIFNYEEVIALDPVLGSILIATSIFSMVFVIINLFVSVLLTVFEQEMKAAKASKEESMLELIQFKFSLLFGIKQQVPLAAAAAPKETQD